MNNELAWAAGFIDGDGCICHYFDKSTKRWRIELSCGMIWLANRFLHIFGWCLVCVLEADDSISRVYPARTKFRGFSEDIEEKGFKQITEYMKDNVDSLIKEVAEE